MELKARNPRLSHEYGEGWVLHLSVDLGSSGTAKKVIDEFKDKDLRVEVREWKEHRSLSANAYFHVLVNKIAGRMNLGEDEVKRSLVLDYGTVAEDKDGNMILLNLPDGTDPETLGVKYAKWLSAYQDHGRTKNTYLIYSETHRLDTKQFSRLLDGAVTEAKNLGIETMIPQDLARLEGYAQKDKGNADTDSGEKKSA